MVDLESMLAAFKVLPVLTLHNEAEAMAVCEALQAGGIRGVEITLRTEAAMGIASLVKQTYPELVVGVGTVVSVEQIHSLADAGIDFAVSPGLDEGISQAAHSRNLAYLPGIATPSELMRGLALGHRVFKFFPAEAIGGLKLLRALSGPFAGVKFCPTGGISADNYRTYLAEDNVLCVGGSWMVPAELVSERRWKEIEKLARAAVEGRARSLRPEMYGAY